MDKKQKEIKAAPVLYELSAERRLLYNYVLSILSGFTPTDEEIPTDYVTVNELINTNKLIPRIGYLKTDSRLKIKFSLYSFLLYVRINFPIQTSNHVLGSFKILQQKEGDATGELAILFSKNKMETYRKVLDVVEDGLFKETIKRELKIEDKQAVAPPKSLYQQNKKDVLYVMNKVAPSSKYILGVVFGVPMFDATVSRFFAANALLLVFELTIVSAVIYFSHGYAIKAYAKNKTLMGGSLVVAATASRVILDYNSQWRNIRVMRLVVPVVNHLFFPNVTQFPVGYNPKVFEEIYKNKLQQIKDEKTTPKRMAIIKQIAIYMITHNIKETPKELDNDFYIEGLIRVKIKEKIFKIINESGTVRSIQPS